MEGAAPPYPHQLIHMSAPDATELTALLDRYERPLVRYALSILGDLEHARDAVQETFIRYVRDDSAPRSKESEKHIEAWLFTVARHRAIDLQRKTSRIIPMPILDNRTSDEPGPAAAAESRDTHANLLRLKFQNDLSYQEIADILELSATNVGFILHTGLKKLREIVRAEPDFADLTSAAS